MNASDPKRLIKPYGDTMDDGFVQLSFTLPIEYSAKAPQAAKRYAAKLNLEDITVVHYQKIADNFTFFVVYGKALPTLDYNELTSDDNDILILSFKEINTKIKHSFHRAICVIGATIGDDAHTVGIDAILNMKGYNQDYGLERYTQFKTFNMGAQVSCEALIEKALTINADVMLVSQTVTQKESHIRNFTELCELLEAENLRSRFLLIAGGARITNDLALEMGYDAGFGKGTLPSHVATFIVNRLLLKKGVGE